MCAEAICRSDRPEGLAGLDRVDHRRAGRGAGCQHADGRGKEQAFHRHTASHRRQSGTFGLRPRFWPPAASPLRLRAYGSLQGMLRMSRRALLVWLVFFGLYAATVGMRASDQSAYAGDEPRFLLTARSLARDGDVNVFDDYRSNAYRGFYMHKLVSGGVPDSAQRTLYEPRGLGFPLLLTPAYLVGGAHGVEFFLAALAALAVALAYLIALRVVPDPWALGATLAVGVSPPLLAYSTTVYPELAAAAALCGAALLAPRLASRRSAWLCFGLLALLPWLGLKYLPAGAVVRPHPFPALRPARRRG